MQIIKTFFEYFFYRIAKLNFKNGNQNNAILSVTVCQFLILGNILMAIYISIFPETRRKFNIYEIAFIVLLFFGMDYYNSKIYKDKYDKYDERWKNESKRKKLTKMILVVLFIIFTWFLVFVNAFIYDRFKKY
ncbi:hypothetical protein AB3G34_05080 [Flavobacterium sp. WC2409]|uniref:Uncharacterized protein n=1 Tax=Flavobacterium sp. WC2409 TaxID=3234139 RepID=A0AB39W5U8_9FLAO